jgi:hypothetical protein
LHFNKKPIEADIGYTTYVAFLSWFIVRNLERWNMNERDLRMGE